MPRRLLSGRVVSSNSNKTIIVKVTRRVKHKMYKKIIKKAKKYHVHDEDNSYKFGDFVTIRIFLKYDLNGKSVIEKISRCSRPGQRIYVGSDEIPRVLDGLGISILSTSRGVVSNKTAKKLGVGGELLCEVFW